MFADTFVRVNGLGFVIVNEKSFTLPQIVIFEGTEDEMVM